MRLSRAGFLCGSLTSATALALWSPPRAHAQATLSFATSTATVGLATQVVRRLDLEKKYDLKLDLTVLDPAAAAKTVLLRQVDAGLFPVLTAADVWSKGQELQLFAPLLYMYTSVLVWSDSPAQASPTSRARRSAASTRRRARTAASGCWRPVAGSTSSATTSP